MRTTFIVCPITRQLCLDEKCFVSENFKSFTDGILYCVRVEDDSIYLRDREGNLVKVWPEEYSMSETIVIYHGGCRDGFCAAWVVNKYFSNILITNPHTTENTQIPANLGIQFIPAYYGQEPPNCKDKDVIIVDFAYSPEVMGQIALDSKSLIWLDHHKTALPVADIFGMLVNSIETNWKNKITYQFLMEKSGAGLAWDYFFPDEPRPWLVDYVEDRDLWLHKLEYSHEINAFIACLEFDFEVWNRYETLTIGDAAISGKVAIMKTEQYIREVCKNVYFTRIDGNNQRNFEGKLKSSKPTGIVYRDIPTINIPQVDCSEVCNELLKLYPKSQFSLYWFKRQDEMYQYGMRSRGEFDVSEVAKLFGGGGHKNAAGFQLNYLLEELK